MPFKFQKLEIWKLAIEFADEVHLLTRAFPKEEMFSLTSQFKRAADSVSLNIAEGSIGQTNAEQRKFIGYAIRSPAECVNCLYLSQRRNYRPLKNLPFFPNTRKNFLQKMNKFNTALSTNHRQASDVDGQS